GSYHSYVVVPETLLNELVERTEADPSAFGSYAAMGPLGSFELRRSDAPTPTALTTWPGVTTFYYAHERHLLEILAGMGIPVIPPKRASLPACERVISELGQLYPQSRPQKAKPAIPAWNPRTSARGGRHVSPSAGFTPPRPIDTVLAQARVVSPTHQAR